MRRLLPLGSVIAVASALMLIPSTAMAAPVPADRTATTSAAKADKPKKEPTAFGLRALGFGTKVVGGQIPAHSGTTGFQVIGCTNLAGIERNGYTADVNLRDQIHVHGVKTELNTYKDGAEVGVYSTHSVARIDIGPATLRGLTSTSHVWHDAKGYHSETSATILNINSNGEDQGIPAPGAPIKIPGVANIYIGKFLNREDKDGAYAVANVVKIEIPGSDTHVFVGHSGAKIDGKIINGLFTGHADAVRASALQGIAHVGATPIVYMPCQGTKGVKGGQDIAGINLADQIVVGAVTANQMGQQTQGRAFGYEQARVATINLGGDSGVTIDAINAKATVTRLKGNPKVITDTVPSSNITFTAGGGDPTTIDLFPEDGIPIPGLDAILKVESNIIEEIPNGISIVGLRLTLIPTGDGPDDSVATINLAEATLAIRPSRLLRA